MSNTTNKKETFTSMLQQNLDKVKAKQAQDTKVLQSVAMEYKKVNPNANFDINDITATNLAALGQSGFSQVFNQNQFLIGVLNRIVNQDVVKDINQYEIPWMSKLWKWFYEGSVRVGSGWILTATGYANGTISPMLSVNDGSASVSDLAFGSNLSSRGAYQVEIQSTPSGSYGANNTPTYGYVIEYSYPSEQLQLIATEPGTAEQVLRTMTSSFSKTYQLARFSFLNNYIQNVVNLTPNPINGNNGYITTINYSAPSSVTNPSERFKLAWSNFRQLLKRFWSQPQTANNALLNAYNGLLTLNTDGTIAGLGATFNNTTNGQNLTLALPSNVYAATDLGNQPIYPSYSPPEETIILINPALANRLELGLYSNLYNPDFWKFSQLASGFNPEEQLIECGFNVTINATPSTQGATKPLNANISNSYFVPDGQIWVFQKGLFSVKEFWDNLIEFDTYNTMSKQPRQRINYQVGLNPFKGGFIFVAPDLTDNSVVNNSQTTYQGTSNS